MSIIDYTVPRIPHILFIILIVLSACNDSKNTSWTNAAADSLQKTNSLNRTTEIAQTSDDALQNTLSNGKTGVVQLPNICFQRQKREDIISCLYERFAYESILCSKIEQLVREKGLTEKLEADYYNPQTAGTKALVILLNGPLRENPDVRYILSHPTYFEIDVDFHHTHPGSVYFDQTGLCCAQTIKRLSELESLGRSDFAWRAREKWLNLYFEIIDMPWDEMASVSAEHFFIEFEKVKQLYNNQEDKRNLRHWIDNAEKILFQAAEKGDIEGYTGRTKEQHLETLRQWVKQMRRGL